VTIVTALLDIGRGKWPLYSRPLSRYHFAMKNVLSMRVPMVIFTDSHSLNFVQEFRDNLGLLEHTKVSKEWIVYNNICRSGTSQWLICLYISTIVFFTL
jgi:hypothetical protein